MSEILKNRYEFLLYLACEDANPNGDPDMGNMPRVDPETMLGVITDSATKRRVRDYVSMTYTGTPGMDIFVEAGVNLNKGIAAARESVGLTPGDKTPAAISKASRAACDMFWDVRTFGAVMSTGPNAGQVRGPVQIAFGRSLDPVQPMDIGLTRVAAAVDLDKGNKGKGSREDYAKQEALADADTLRTMGRKAYVPFGLYAIRGFVSANLAQQTGFTELDFDVLTEALANMYDATRSASKGMMHLAAPLILFKHCSDPSKPESEQARQAKLGCAPAQRLFELVSCKLNDGVRVPRSYRDYTCSVDMSRKPARIDIGFRAPYSDGIVWNGLPDGEDWVSI